MKKINFTKMAATGNDFIVIDNRFSPSGCRLLAKKLCDRKLGIGADGLLVLEKSVKADFKMRIFNPDGSEPDMCGNGSRCIALYAKNRKIAPASMPIETKAGLLYAVAGKNKVKINMTEPKDIKLSINLKAGAKTYRLHHINTGVPHTVFFTNEVDKIDLNAFGKSIRYHSMFAPEGTNVNIVRIENASSVSIRTYERGVEAETLACGTGSVACAIIFSLVKNIKSPVKVFAKGGELRIYFERKDNKFYNVFLEGEAREVFSGEICI
ncbi:diaminopimelate epimerase [bacterium]|nr:MAG: diaminopimelate epimerase [bacterium]